MYGATARKPAAASTGSWCRKVRGWSGNPCSRRATGPEPASRPRNGPADSSWICVDITSLPALSAHRGRTAPSRSRASCGGSPPPARRRRFATLRETQEPVVRGVEHVRDRLGDEVVLRVEVRVEPAVREPGGGHHLSHADALRALRPDRRGSLTEHAEPRPLLVALAVAHV